MLDKNKNNSENKEDILNKEDKIENDESIEEKEIEDEELEENNDSLDQENKNFKDNNISDRKKTIWVYAVILFMSAFIVLLITMFSQIKLNTNYETLKSENSENEEKVGEYKFIFFNSCTKT